MGIRPAKDLYRTLPCWPGSILSCLEVPAVGRSVLRLPTTECLNQTIAMAIAAKTADPTAGSATVRTLWGGTAFFVSSGASRFGSFLFLCLASRLLATADFGILALGLSVLGLLQAVAALGLPTTALRFLSGAANPVKRSAYGCILLFTGVAAISSAAALFLSARVVATFFFEVPSLVTPLRILAIAILFSVPALVMRAILQAQERIGPMMASELIQGIGKIVVLFALVPAMASVNSILWTVVVSAAASCVAAALFLRSLPIRPSFAGRWSGPMRRIARYAVPSAFISVSYVFALQSDRLMLGLLSDTSAVALFTAASSLAMIGTILHGGMVSMFMPIVSERYLSGAMHETHDAYRSIGKWVGLANSLLLLSFVALGPWLLALFGEAYSTPQGYYALVTLGGAYFVGTIVGPTGAFLQMTDRNRLELINTLVFVTVNLGLNTMFIPRYGALGAAFATLLSGIVRNCCQYIEILRIHQFLPVSRESWTVILITLVGTGFCLAVSSFGLRGLIAFSAAAALVYQTMLQATAEERRALSSVKARLGGLRRWA